jgi:hypothetical protein
MRSSVVPSFDWDLLVRGWAGLVLRVVSSLFQFGCLWIWRILPPCCVNPSPGGEVLVPPVEIDPNIFGSKESPAMLWLLLPSGWIPWYSCSCKADAGLVHWIVVWGVVWSDWHGVPSYCRVAVAAGWGCRVYWLLARGSDLDGRVSHVGRLLAAKIQRRSEGYVPRGWSPEGDVITHLRKRRKSYSVAMWY